MQVCKENIGEILRKIRSNDKSLSMVMLAHCRPNEPRAAGHIPKSDIVEILDALKTNTRVKKLTIHDIDGADYWLGTAIGEMLKENTSIDDLEVSRVMFKEKTFNNFCKGLASNSNLKKLNLASNEMVFDDSMDLSMALSDNKSLLELRVANNKLEDDSIDMIAHGLEINESLLKFSFPENQIGIQGFNSLLDLLLANKSITHADFTSIHDIDFMGQKRLEQRSEGEGLDDIMDKVCEVIEKNDTLIDLNLSNVDLSLEKYMDDIIAAINVNKTLMRINLENSYIEGSDLLLFLKWIKNNTLACFDIGKNPKYFSDIDVKEIKKEIEKTWKRCTNLINLGEAFASENGLPSDKSKEFNDYIDMITNDEIIFSKTGVANIQKKLPALIERVALYNKDFKHVVESMLSIVMRKVKKNTGIDLIVPDYYKKYSVLDAERLDPKAEKNTVANELAKIPKHKLSKINFTDLAEKIDKAPKPISISEMFKKVSKRKKYPIAYHSGLTNQLDELLDFLDNKNAILTKEDLLYKPSKDNLTLLDMIIDAGKLDKVITVKNWLHDPEGLNEIAKIIPVSKLYQQMGSKFISMADTKKSISAARIKQGRKPIKIMF